MKPKFRAWDERAGLTEVISIDLLEKKIKVSHWEYGVSNYFPLDDVELMQSTGLKDKNGVEIFEGDIIKTKTGTLQFVEYVRASVTKDWSETVAAFKCRQGDEYFYFDLATDEVIGNIYENPKLLEVEG